MKYLITSVAVALLTGCATYQPVPEGYAGPVAKVRDTGSYVDGYTKGQIFSLMEVDGQKIKDSFMASNKQSYGQGFTLTLDIQNRLVPIKPMSVKLRGSHITGAPIHAIASKAAGTYFTVEGIVNFTPRPDTLYLVKGELKSGASSVWIEEAESGTIVTDKVSEQQ